MKRFSDAVSRRTQWADLNRTCTNTSPVCFVIARPLLTQSSPSTLETHAVIQYSIFNDNLLLSIINAILDTLLSSNRVNWRHIMILFSAWSLLLVISVKWISHSIVQLIKHYVQNLKTPNYDNFAYAHWYTVMFGELLAIILCQKFDGSVVLHISCLRACSGSLELVQEPTKSPWIHIVQRWQFTGCHPSRSGADSLCWSKC